MDKRNEILSYPLRQFGPELLKQTEKGKPVHSTLSAMALMAYAAAPTFFGNMYLPVELISSGLRPHPVNLGLSHYIPHVHIPSRAYWLEPVFEVFHGSSKAYKTGAKVGGKLGGRIGARLIPGLAIYTRVYTRSINQIPKGICLLQRHRRHKQVIRSRDQELTWHQCGHQVFHPL